MPRNIDDLWKHLDELLAKHEVRFHWIRGHTGHAENERADALAIVHTHSVHATALACAQREIPAFHYMVGVTGADKVPVARYATFGTEALARNVADALGLGYASLIANHGLIVCGRTLAHACRLAAEVETLAQQYILTLQAGVPRLLDRAEMARVIAKFAEYGPDMEAMPEAAE